MSGQEFSDAIDDTLLSDSSLETKPIQVLSRANGKHFVAELAHLFEALVEESAFEAFALKAAMTLPALMLQKPHAKSKRPMTTYPVSNVNWHCGKREA